MYLDDVGRKPTCRVSVEAAERIVLMQKFELGRRGFATATALLLFATILPAQAGTQAAVAAVQQLIDGLLVIMKAGPSTPFQQRFATLGPVIDKAFDLPVILQESVGASWATLPADQQAILTQAFRRYTIASYVNSFDDFNGQKFTINPETRSVGTEQVVETKVLPAKGNAHEIDYVMREGSDGWRVVDVLADGSISRVAVQRSDFRRILARGGAPGLAESLRSKSADLSDGPS
jgi:phospholipid transport system substrate-binding protein